MMGDRVEGRLRRDLEVARWGVGLQKAISRSFSVGKAAFGAMFGQFEPTGEAYAVLDGWMPKISAHDGDLCGVLVLSGYIWSSSATKAGRPRVGLTTSGQPAPMV